VESRVPTQPLGQRATLHSGTAGFAASRMAASLYERDTAPRGRFFDFVVSGNIDRYAIALGDVRFMNRTFARPVLPSHTEHLTDNKRRLFEEPKIVIAGMTRRLEAAFDAAGGIALGVSVYAAADIADHPLYLLAVLNSRLLSHLFRLRYRAKHLAGGFLAINKGQLARLPIRVIDRSVAEDRRRHDRIVRLASQMIERMVHRQQGDADGSFASEIASIDSEIDRLVYQLYGLSEAEFRAVDEATVAVGR
jgi:hypothetical protein